MLKLNVSTGKKCLLLFLIQNIHRGPPREIKNTAVGGIFDFWQGQIDNIRTEISLYEAEIMETLDLLEEFLNDLKH